ncbi:MAG: helix-turn-helix transcriptional regulator [Candidatus Korobacteraceae bacterium]
MNIGETIRRFRLQRGMSQGDIEKSTGLLRCYLSRVENGHTIPSLETLGRITSAMGTSLGELLADSSGEPGSRVELQLREQESRFLNSVRRYSPQLNDSDKKLIVAMVKKMAASGN